MALVKRRDMEAVAVEVPASARGAGEIGMKRGAFLGGGGGCSSRILRRHFTVCLAGQPSDELDEGEDSSIVGVIGR